VLLILSTWVCLEEREYLSTDQKPQRHVVVEVVEDSLPNALLPDGSTLLCSPSSALSWGVIVWGRDWCRFCGRWGGGRGGGGLGRGWR